MTPRKARIAWVVAASAAVLTSAACGGGHLGAAEPATAPPAAQTPAGTVVHVGTEPEGIVYDPQSRLVAVAVHDPDRLLLLDPNTLTVRRSVRLPGSARHLQLGSTGDQVLVPAETADELVQVDVASGHETITKVGRQPHDAAAAQNGDIVVGDEFGHAISIVRDGRVVKTIHDLTQPGGVVADGDTAAVVDVGAFTLSTYDLTSLRRTARVRAGAGPTHVVLVDGHRLVVADTRGNAILVFSEMPLRRIARLPLADNPYGITVDHVTDTVWVTLTASNEVVGLDVSGTRPRIIARYPTVRQPNTVAVAPGGRTLYVTGTDGGVVERISR